MKGLYDYILEKEDLTRFINHRYDDEIKSALWDYVSGYTTAINNHLRRGKDVPEITKLLDQAFNDKKFAKKRVLDVYRTVDLKYLEKVYGITLKNISTYVNNVLIHKGYTSTTETCQSPWSSRWLNDEVIIHITSIRDQSCIVVNKVFKADEIDCSDQQEILLPRNLKFKIVGFHIEKGKKLLSKDGNLFIDVQIA